MDIKIEVENYKEVSQKFAERSKEMPKAIQRIVSKVALTVERFGKIYSPVKTGRMRASIIPINISQMSASTGPQVFYAPFVHARIPFMFAARQSTLPSVQQIIDKEIKEALK